ncbi:hypothetical protein OJE16_20820 [Pantoea tagorei]
MNYFKKLKSDVNYKKRLIVNVLFLGFIFSILSMIYVFADAENFLTYFLIVSFLSFPAYLTLTFPLADFKKKRLKIDGNLLQRCLVLYCSCNKIVGVRLLEWEFSQRIRYLLKLSEYAIEHFIIVLPAMTHKAK